MSGRVKSITLRDFKSLRSIRFDLTEGSDGVPRDLALIYGENGIGKTNIIESIVFLKMTTETRLLSETLTKRWEGPETMAGETTISGFLECRVPMPIPEVPMWDIRSLADRFRSIGSVSGPEMEFAFVSDGCEGEYRLRIGDDGRVCEESLAFRINKRSGTIFSLRSTGNGVESEFSTVLFKGSRQRGHFMEAIGSWWGDHTFLSIMRAEAMAGSADGIGTGILDAISFIDGIVVLCRGSDQISFDGLDPVLRNPMEGRIQKGAEPSLARYGAFLDYLLFDLFSDCKGASYASDDSDGTVRYFLRLRRMVGGEEVEVPISEESDGVRRVVAMSPALYMCSKGRSVFIDDFDSGMHVCLMPAILEGEMRGGVGQLVAATHCTLLLESVGPQSCYVMQGDMGGSRWITSFPKVARTMTNHNNRLRYEADIFGGTPHTGHVDVSACVSMSEEDGQ